MVVECNDCGAKYVTQDTDEIISCEKCGSVNLLKKYGRSGHMSVAERDQVIDNVNHPTHYQTSSGLETFEVIKAFTEDLKGIEAVYTGNVLKYMCRWNKKNGLEDLEKAEWYLKHLIEEVKNRKEKGE